MSDPVEVIEIMPRDERNPMLASVQVKIHHHPTGSFSYVRLSELPINQKDLERLERWISGQTRPVVDDGLSEDCLYLQDWLRFVELNEGKAVAWD